MHFHVMTLFPEMIMEGLSQSIIGRALKKECITLDAVNIRDYTLDKHKKVDDYTYGGGAGMLMQAQPVFDAYQAVVQAIGKRKGNSELLPATPRVIYTTPQGEVFTQSKAAELAKEEDLIILCGHYEGIDERVLEEIVTDYISIGDYVLTGGELPAMIMIDAISRLVPGVLNNQDSAQTESHSNGLLEYPQYSRPEVWHEKKVPEILLSGHHANIEKWRLEQSLLRTKERRPDMYEAYIAANPPAPVKKRGRKKQSLEKITMDNMSFNTKRIAEGYTKRPFLHKQVMEKLMNHIGRQHFELGLDIGCGAGLSTKALKLICNKVVGTDISQEMIEVANEVCRNDTDVSFLVSKAEEVAMETNVDIVTVAGAIQWIEKQSFLNKLSNILSIGGYLIIYDFAISDEMKNNSEYNRWWHEQYLIKFPKPYRNEEEWTQADTMPFGFHIEAKEKLELDYSFDMDSFIEFMMIQSNVNVVLEEGSQSVDRVKKWFEETLSPIFNQEEKVLEFKGYMWIIQNMSK